MNLFMGIGRLTKKAELRYTTSNLAVASFTLAIPREMKKEETDFISCVAYGKQAEVISKYLDKGSQVGIEGHIQTGSYEKEGKKIYTTDVVVEKITFINTQKKEETQQTQTEIVQKAMSEDPYVAMGQQVSQEELPF